MDILVIRKKRTEICTIGELYINGAFFCYTLEDKDRGLKQADSIIVTKAKKIFGKTAIPTGFYSLAMTFSNRFKKYLPQILDVPAFGGIRIHAGNTSEHTEGCLLLGYQVEGETIFESRRAVDDFIKVVVSAEKTEKITISIQSV